MKSILISSLLSILILTGCVSAQTPTQPLVENSVAPMQSTISHTPTVLPNTPNPTETALPIPSSTLQPSPTIVPAPTPTLKPIEDFQLEEFSPLVLSYETNKWTLAFQKESNNTILSNNVITGCNIWELGGTDVSIQFIASAYLGKISYSIYYAGISKPNVSYDRIYFSNDKSLKPASNYQPSFVLDIPYDAKLNCITEANKVFATLHTTEPQ